MADAIDRPAHYTWYPSGIECIEISQHFSFNLGNAIKYIWRAGEKGSALEDLEKARKYVQFERARLSMSRLACTDNGFVTARPDLYERRNEIADGCKFAKAALLDIIYSSGMSGLSGAAYLKYAEDFLTDEINNLKAQQPQLPLEPPQQKQSDTAGTPASDSARGCYNCAHCNLPADESPCDSCMDVYPPGRRWEAE